MKKVLFVATVDSHIRHFHIPYLKYFKDKGYEVHVATSDDENEQFEYCDKKHKICMARNPFHKSNLDAVKQLADLMLVEKYDIVHCHTPVGSVVTRLAVRKLRKKDGKIKGQTSWSPKKDMQVLYTAHGFHFFKGAPLKNWILYYPIERWLSKYTDKLITINKEDYARAIDFSAKRVYLIDGVGVDAAKFNFVMSEDAKKKLRKELSSINESFKINDDDIIVSCIGELNWNKNQGLIISVMKEIMSDDELPHNIKVLLVGTGSFKTKFEKQVKNNDLQSNILFTGYRRDVQDLLKMTDISISCSHREGLPFNLIEAQMAGLPAVATDCRGNSEIIKENQTGYLISLKDEKKCKERFKNKLLKLVESESMRERMGKNALENSKKYRLSKIQDEMIKIYEDEL